MPLKEVDEMDERYYDGGSQPMPETLSCDETQPPQERVLVAPKKFSRINVSSLTSLFVVFASTAHQYSAELTDPSHFDYRW